MMTLLGKFISSKQSQCFKLALILVLLMSWPAGQNVLAFDGNFFQQAVQRVGSLKENIQEGFEFSADLMATSYKLALTGVHQATAGLRNHLQELASRFPEFIKSTLSLFAESATRLTAQFSALFYQDKKITSQGWGQASANGFIQPVINRQSVFADDATAGNSVSVESKESKPLIRADVLPTSVAKTPSVLLAQNISKAEETSTGPVFSSQLTILQSQIGKVLAWEADIKNLRDIAQKLYSHASSSQQSTAPIYINQQGLQVGGSATFDSLVVSGLAGIHNLSAEQAALGATANDKLTVNAAANFTSPVTLQNTFTIGNLSIDQSGNLTTAGSLTSSATSNVVSFLASSTNVVLTVTQTGTGHIVDFKDDSTVAFTILDGGNVGIGTSTPTGILSVATSTGASVFHVDKSGYIGIGTSSPTYMLSLKSQANVKPFQIASSSGSDMLVLDTVGRFGIGTSSPNYTFDMKGIANVNPFNISSSTGANLLTILQSGNLGIGTSSPNETLTVAGAVRSTTAFKDTFAWGTNSQKQALLSLGLNMGGLGGGVVSPGMNFATSTHSWAVYDTTAINASSKGFFGAVFDGRYVYFIPDYSAGSLGQVTRYDTTGSFTASTSYSVYDTTAVNASSKGFRSAIFDGRYIYFVPDFNGAYSGQVTRYDTTGVFTASDSYSVYDTTAVNASSKGFVGAVFDGRYVYFVPNYNGAAYSGQVTRYDTTGVFTASTSYSVYDTTNVNANSKGFVGAVFDGRYVYFVPNYNGAYSGQVTRYDTTGVFTAADSYSVYNTTAVNASSKGFYGAVFDGRYVYFVPNYNGAYFGQITRYDTTGSFTSSGSYSVYNTTAINASSKGFRGAVFDGRYIYFVPYYNGAYLGQVTRYDTTGSFTASDSYSVYDTTNVNANSKGFRGAVFDGRYVYFVPYNNGSYFGQITRYDTGSPAPQQGINQIARSQEFVQLTP